MSKVNVGKESNGGITSSYKVDDGETSCWVEGSYLAQPILFNTGSKQTITLKL